MIDFIEYGIRGGLSQISDRYETANHKYLGNYDENKPSISIEHLDANNLYGNGMSTPMPY